jgi:PAS domain S-box-containing protein
MNQLSRKAELEMRVEEQTAKLGNANEELRLEVAERRQAEEALQRSNSLLRALSHTQSEFIADVDPHDLFDELLSTLLVLTESEYGFIGEVLHSSDGAPYLKTHAITNIAWNEETRQFYEKHAPTGMEFYNLKTLFGTVVTTGKPVIANDPAADPRRSGLPAGHPPLNSFLGLPFYYGEQMVGMVGIANCPNGYDEELVTYLQPFLATCANIIEAYRNEQRRQQAEEALRESEERYKRLLGSVTDYIYTVKVEDGRPVATAHGPGCVAVTGYTSEEYEADPYLWHRMVHEEDRDAVTEQATRLLSGEVVPTLEHRILHKAGFIRWVRNTPVSRIDKEGRLIAYDGLIADITERKQAEEALRLNEARLEALLELGQMTQAPQQQITDFALEKGVALTKSKIGFLAFMNEDETVATMHVWSKTAVAECGIIDKPSQFVIAESGIWGEVVRQRRPIIINDYAAPHPDKKGNPEGHVEVSRYMSIPVFDGDLIVAVAAVGNKEAEYDETDVRQLRLLMDGMWQIVQRKQTEEALRKLSSAVEQTADLMIITDKKGVIEYVNSAFEELTGYSKEEAIGRTPRILQSGRHDQEFYETLWKTILSGEVFRTVVINKKKSGELYYEEKTITPVKDAPGNITHFVSTSKDITESKLTEETLRQAVEVLQQRNRQLALLNRAGQTFSSTLELDQVLVTILEEVRYLLNVVACSIWLVDPETKSQDGSTGELVCRQATGPQSEIVRGWRLALGEGLVGWVAHSGKSLIVPDIWADERHFKGLDQQTGLKLRSILSVPMWTKNEVIGVIQVVDAEVNRFSPADLTLLEPLAATAAIAIENARLYEQARQDAETKAVLLQEVNHRVKNNLSAIIGLLYAERGHTGMTDRPTYQAIMTDLINRIQGMATVHRLLSASEWSPLLLSELAEQIVYSTLRMLPPDKSASVDVSSSPVRVMPDRAHHLALVINELTTNTVKYALPEDGTASITIRIAVEGEATPKGHPILFEFRDDGSGYPEDMLLPDHRRYNVGFDLIQSIVHDGLGGELVLRNDRGAVTTIRFKTEVALDET